MASYDTNSVYYNLGLKGSILPKLNGQFSLGYHTLNFSTNTNDFNAFGATSALTWILTPKLRTLFNFSWDLDADGYGRTYGERFGSLSTIYYLNV